MDFENFVQYVFEFYGAGGVYPMDATVEQIANATNALLSTPDYDFAGDSVDRERVRDLLIEKFGCKWPV